MSTLAKKFSYFSLFLAAASFTIWLNVSLSRQYNTAFVLATIVAALGALYNKANSPKASPSLYTFKWILSPSALFFLKQSNSP